LDTNIYIAMNGTWEVDAVKGTFCTNMSVTGPPSQEAWSQAKQFAGSQGVTLNLGTCASQGYSDLQATVAPKTFSRDGYTSEWDGKVWSK